MNMSNGFIIGAPLGMGVNLDTYWQKIITVMKNKLTFKARNFDFEEPYSGIILPDSVTSIDTNGCRLSLEVN